MLKNLLIMVFSISTMLFAKKATYPKYDSDFDHDHKKSTSQELVPGYSTPASLKLDGGCNFFINGSFVYYQALEGGLDLAYMPAVNANPLVGNGSPHLIYYQMDFDYKPAFKAKAGYRFNHDKWEINAEYFWYHVKNHTAYNLNSAVSYLFPFFTYGWGAINYGTNSNSTSADWRLNMDCIDLLITRPFYSGQKLTFKPHVGLRLLFIKQRYDQTIAAHLYNGTAFTPYYHGKNKSWSLGPRMGLDGAWRFTDNFRFFGNMAANFSYTQYHISYVNLEEVIQNAPTLFTRSVNRNELRPMGEFALGLGYGGYFNNYKLHLDLSVGYGVYVFWDQEMLQYDEHFGDLYLQGLTVTGQFDF